MDKVDLNGHISESGEVIVHNKRLMQEWAGRFKGKNVRIKIERAGSRRSLPQNSYYHAVIIQEVKLALLELGHMLSDDEVHFFLKSKFNSVQIPSKEGELIELPGTTTTLTKTEFSEYVERIIQWSAEYLNISIPAPNTDLQLQL